MANKLNKRAKIIIATSVAAILLVGAIVSIILVLAATQQNISSNISVYYVVDGVAVRSSASYAVLPTSESVRITRTSMTTGSGDEEFEINAVDEKTTTNI